MSTQGISMALRRQHALELTNERQAELGQTFNQRVKFAVWDRRRDRAETVWDRRRSA
jgi:hypothetical protein